jgi:hypothetical protein
MGEWVLISRTWYKEGLRDFDAVLRQPPYPGKQYGGVVTWPFR